MFDGEIKTSSYIKKIKVNDNGEYIEINLNDSELIENYTNMVEEISKCVEEKSESNDNTEIKDVQKAIDSIKQTLSIHKKIAMTLDKYMGEGTCKKVFGVNYPTADSVFEFIVIYQDYIEKFTGEKMKSIESVKSNYLDKLKTRQRR